MMFWYFKPYFQIYTLLLLIIKTKASMLFNQPINCKDLEDTRGFTICMSCCFRSARGFSLERVTREQTTARDPAVCRGWKLDLLGWSMISITALQASGSHPMSSQTFVTTLSYNMKVSCELPSFKPVLRNAESSGISMACFTGDRMNFQLTNAKGSGYWASHQWKRHGIGQDKRINHRLVQDDRLLGPIQVTLSVTQPPQWRLCMMQFSLRRQSTSVLRLTLTRPFTSGSQRLWGPWAWALRTQIKAQIYWFSRSRNAQKYVSKFLI